MNKAGRLGSLQSVLVTLLMGSVPTGWAMIILPRALSRGYLPVSSMNFLTSQILVAGPFVLSIYAVMVLSESRSWYGSRIGDKQRSVECFRRYVHVWLFGAALTGLACSVFGVVTSDSSLSTVHMSAGAASLLAVLVSLWGPKGGILSQK